MAAEVVVRGTVKADGSLELAGPVGLPPGPVEVTVTPAASARTPASPRAKTWWDVLQEIRADREARGYPFMTDAEVTAHINELRAEDDRLDRLARPADPHGRQE
jgi:hypothetical protein